MISHKYPRTGYGVEVFTHREGWVLIDSIQQNRDEAERIREIYVDNRAVPDPNELRVVALTITRKEDTE